MASQQTKRRWLVPEVVQTSAMDCGPAALKCLLEGFNIPISYGRLREACQTDIDGTSIDVIEVVARQLGLDAEQVMLPLDHLLLPEAAALPAMIVVRRPDGFTHFVVVWRRHGPLIQVMDPATGRRWIAGRRFIREVYRHSFRVPAMAWREWAASEEFLAPLRRRLLQLGASSGTATAAIDAALAQPGWYPLAALDAVVRMLNALVQAGGLRPGRRAITVARTFFEQASHETPGECRTVPASYWSVLPAPQDPNTDTEEQLILQGAVLLRVRGQLAAPGSGAAETEGPERLSPELAAALAEPPTRPGREIWRLLRADGLLTPVALMSALALAVGAILVETLLFRGLFDIAWQLNLANQRIGAVIALLTFVALLLLLELPIAAESLRLGRHLEARLRMALLRKLPHLGDRYFQSRPISDMAERSHSIYLTRLVPELGIRFMQSAWDLLFTLVGIIIIDPASAPLALLIAGLAVAIPLAAQPLLNERDLRVRSHSGALHNFYLDALLGLVAVRAHSAERAVRREHEGLLVEWARASQSLVRISLVIEGIQSFACLGVAGWLLLQHFWREGITGGVLLLVFWTLKLPAIGQRLALLARQYPVQRNIMLRLLEPLATPEETSDAPAGTETAPDGHRAQPERQPAAAADHKAPRRPRGIAIVMEGVSVLAAGHTILREIDLNIAPGEHVAIVGPSGAGKSSLIGLLLGWHRIATGRLLVDGAPLSGEQLTRLRRETAWVDPAIQIWNRSFLENLCYSTEGVPFSAIGRVIEASDLRGVLQKLPGGLQTPLGEGGALLSGGEGQRVRLGRALLQTDVRLALLDEPFRGLDRDQRRRHLAQARAWWKDATLLCVTHDVRETLAFNRVLVVEGGRIVEDGSPHDLAVSGSRYRDLLDTEDAVRQGLWEATLWRRIRLKEGRVQSKKMGSEDEWSN